MEGGRTRPRLADFACLLWGTWLNGNWIDAAVRAYRQHVASTDDEPDRLATRAAVLR